MILIGLVLILLALAGGAFLYTGTHLLSDKAQMIDLTVLGVTVSLSPLALAVAGALAGLLLWFGWAFVRTGAKRSARRRREGKEKSRLAQDDQSAIQGQRAVEPQGPQHTATDDASHQA